MSDRPFDLICLDTNQFHSSGWPLLSDKMKWFIKLATGLGIKICIPEPVLFEIPNDFIEDVNKKLPAAVDIAKKLRIIGIEVPELIPPRPEAIRQGYDSYIDGIFRQYGFERIRYTSLSLPILFEKAAKKEPPFESKGKNFQDAVIYWSFLDHLKNEGKKGAFISADGAFRDNHDRLTKIAKSSGVEVVLYDNLDEIITELTAHSDRQAKVWQQQRDELEGLLRIRWDEISEFISNALRNPQSGLTGDIHFDQVGKCRMFEIRKPWIPPLTDRGPDSPVLMKFAVRVIFPLVVDDRTLNRLFWPSFADPYVFSVSNSKAEGVQGDLCVEVHGEISIREDHVVDFRLRSLNRIEGGYRAFFTWEG